MATSSRQLNALWGMTRVEFKLFTRSFINMFFVLAFPSMMLLVFGGIYGNDPQDMFDGHGTVDISVPAYTAMVIAVTAIMSLPLSIAGYREKKILKRFRATPLHPADLLVSQVAANLVMTVAGMLLLLILGKVLFDMHFLGNVLEVVIALLLSVLSMFSLGFVIASFAPDTRSATAIANLVYFPMIFLTGATLPLEIMPDTMVSISKILPLTYAVDMLKEVWLGGHLSNCGLDIAVLLGVALVSTAVAVVTFKWE